MTPDPGVNERLASIRLDPVHTPGHRNDTLVWHPQNLPRVDLARSALQPAEHVRIVFLESLMGPIRKLPIDQVVVERGQDFLQ